MVHNICNLLNSLVAFAAAVIGSAASLCAIVLALACILSVKSGARLQQRLSQYVNLWRDPASGGSSKQSLILHKSQGMDDLKFESKAGKRVVLGRGSFGVVC